jgi:hypothetical protein
MNISSIGVQQILPETGIGRQSNTPTPDQQNGGEDNPVMAPDRAPAAPGTGQIVDKTV